MCIRDRNKTPSSAIALADVHRHTGNLYLQRRLYDKANQSYERALEIVQGVGACGLLAELSCEMAVLSYLQGEHADAVVGFRESLATYDEVFGSEHRSPHKAASYLGLGLCRHELDGTYDEVSLAAGADLAKGLTDDGYADLEMLALFKMRVKELEMKVLGGHPSSLPAAAVT